MSSSLPDLDALSPDGLKRLVAQLLARLAALEEENRQLRDESIDNVGTVHFATARTNKGIHHAMERFEHPDRAGVQLASVALALEMLRDAL